VDIRAMSIFNPGRLQRGRISATLICEPVDALQFAHTVCGVHLTSGVRKTASMESIFLNYDQLWTIESTYPSSRICTMCLNKAQLKPSFELNLIDQNKAGVVGTVETKPS
jgi:hypothetical protein